MLDHLDPFRRRSVALGLYRMLTGTRFDLCVVTEALRAADLDAPRDAVAALRLHHCARFAEMPPGFHADLAAATLTLFAARPVSAEPAPAEAGGVLRDLAAAAGLRPVEVVWEGGAVARTSEGHRGKEREPSGRRSRAGDAPASAMQRDAAPGSPQPSAARALSSQTTSPAPAARPLLPTAQA